MKTYTLKISVTIFLIFSSVSVIYLFYKEQVRSFLPTSVPSNYLPTSVGQGLGITSLKKLTLIHFFNPECPCSKFNTKHIQYLAAQYSKHVEFLAYSTSGSLPTNYPIEVRLDADDKMAKQLGVYSTPQAVLLDAEGKLLYRGNYNKSRYCSNRNSEYVVQAIESALHKKSTIAIMQISGLPYGCEIFNDK